MYKRNLHSHEGMKTDYYYFLQPFSLLVRLGDTAATEGGVGFGEAGFREDGFFGEASFAVVSTAKESSESTHTHTHTKGGKIIIKFGKLKKNSRNK